jgi:hypothetical protein
MNSNDVWAFRRLIRTAVQRKQNIYIHLLKTGGNKRRGHIGRNERKDKRGDNVNYNPSQMQRKRDINQRRRNADRN